MGELFLGKPDELVLAFDAILQQVVHWGEMSVGTATHSIVFTSKKAWLIIKPMKQELDVKFYNKEILESDRVKKTTDYRNKFAHHIRLQHPEQVDKELLRILKVGYVYSLK